MGTEADDREALRALRERHVGAVNSRDVDSVLADMSEDIVYMPPGAPSVIGKAALREVLHQAYQQSYPRIAMSRDHLEVVGDWAVERGIVSGTMGTEQSVEPAPVDLTYVYVYRRDSDGGWKLVWDIYNANSS